MSVGKFFMRRFIFGVFTLPVSLLIFLSFENDEVVAAPYFLPFENDEGEGYFSVVCE